MKPIWRAILFFLPLTAVFGTPALVLWLGGEFTSPDTVIARQERGDQLVLFGPAYTDSALYLKVRRLIHQRPKVLALGNSRVMQFRRGFFLPGTSFYNAGGTVARLPHFLAFLKDLPPEALPETLIIATDLGYFNASFDKLDLDKFSTAWLDEQMTRHASPDDIFQKNWQTVWTAIRQGKIKFARLASLDGLGPRIGLNALCNEQGFRNDGSYLYGGVELNIHDPRHRDYQFAGTLRHIARGVGRFAYADGPSPGSLREMDALLDWCQERKIHVIGFFPPHAHAVWAAMMAKGEKYAFIPKLETELRARFDARGFEFFDFNDFATLGSPDDDAIDGYHGSERTYLRLVIAMLESGSQLNACADLPALRGVLVASKSHTSLFPERP